MRRPAAPPPELAGLTFERVLGSGGFADVYLYQQRFPRRRVAVKVLTADLSAATRSSFVAEANLMAQLSAHPFIVSIFAADIAEDGRPYFVMEYCSGPSMAERYKRKPLSVEDALRTGVRVAGAVATAHSAGVLHRDIKPANILTNEFGWPALTDFGISSALEGELPVHTISTTRDPIATSGTGSNASVGMSIPWSPPEMFVDDPQPDVRSDVFSLAATVYTLLAGRTPFEVQGRPNGALDLIGRIERGVIAPIGRSDVPRSLVAVLAKGMATTPDERYATAVDFGRALQRVETELGFPPTPLDVPRVADADDRTPDAGGEETELRRVVMIDAQPTPETVLRGAPVEVKAQPAAPEATVLRPAAATIVDPDPRPVVEHETVGPPARSRRLGLILSTIGGAVVVAAVVLAVLVSGALPRESADPLPDDPGVIGADIPAVPVVEVDVTDGGDRATFRLVNPQPADGDQLRWSDPTDAERRGVIDDVRGVVERRNLNGARVCIEVTVVRSNGRSSPATTACTDE